MQKKPQVHRSKLEKNHGTPAEFAKAVWSANADGLITIHEAIEAIRKYEHEWTEAKP